MEKATNRGGLANLKGHSSIRKFDGPATAKIESYLSPWAIGRS